MEELKHKMLMGWGRIALLREGESPILPGEDREEEKEGLGSLVGHFYITLNLEVGDYVITWLLTPVG
jgi:hypothetical protein